MTLINLLLLTTVKPLILVGIGWWQYCASQSAAASSRHLGLLLIFALLPLTSLLASEWLVILPSIALQFTLDHRLEQWLALPVLNSLQWPLTQWLLGLYYLGVFWVIFYLALGIHSLWQQERASKPHAALQALVDDLRRTLALRLPVQVRACDKISCPQVWGVFRPTLFVPVAMANWPKQQLQFMLLHELGHVARYDWLAHILVRCICAFYWLLPPVWWLAHALENMCERACDDWVLAAKQRGPEYAELLLSITQSLRNTTDLPTQAINGGSAHYQRILALLDRYQDRDKVDRREFVRTLVVSLLCLLPLSMLQASIQPIKVLQEEIKHFRYVPLSVSKDRPDDQARLGSGYWLPQFEPVTLPPSERHTEEMLVVAYASVPTPDSGDNLGIASKPVMAAGGLDLELDSQHLMAQEVLIQGYLPMRTVTPHYPPSAIRRGIEGRVIVQFSIDAHGTPYDPHIVYAQPKGVFESAVLKALAQSRFRPHSINRQPVAVSGISEEFVFRLLEHEREKLRPAEPFNGPTEIAVKQ